MATPFPTDEYPLKQGITVDSGKRINRIIMDDGTPHLQVLASSKYKTIPLEFAPMKEAQAAALCAYIESNETTELEITFLGSTVTGYFWSDAKTEYKNGNYNVSVDFYGVKS